MLEPIRPAVIDVVGPEPDDEHAPADHQTARGSDQRAPTVRPRVVVNDPALSASQPVADLAASALNALGHAAEGPCTPLANPVARLAADDGARLLARTLQAEPDREGLALGALLAGYVIDSTGYGLHHVLAQTLVRLAGAGHGPANAVLLPHTLGALEKRTEPHWQKFLSLWKA